MGNTPIAVIIGRINAMYRKGYMTDFERNGEILVLLLERYGFDYCAELTEKGRLAWIGL